VPGTLRLASVERREQLLGVGAELFAARAYEDVSMEDVAREAAVSRALLYRHFASKPRLFAAVYQSAADRLLSEVQLDPAVPLAQQVAAGLDAHIDYFVANRNTVLAANRVLAGDPTVQAIISGELATLRARLLNTFELRGESRAATSALLTSWLVFVRVLCVEWLAQPSFSREQLRDSCVGALLGALGPTEGAVSR